MIDIKNFSIIYDNEILFPEINLKIEKQKWIAIVGKSGVGKSSLLKSIAGIKTGCYNIGSIKTDEKISWMGQSDLLMPWLNVLKNVLISKNLTCFKKEDKLKAIEILESLNLQNKIFKYSFELSGGEKQRVALARTLLMESKIVLLDESFSSIDAITKKKVYKIFKEKMKNKTVICVTHDIDEAIHLCDEIIVLRKNKNIKLFKNNKNQKILKENIWKSI